MKSIEQKLKADAQAFRQNPNDGLHDRIMRKIKAQDVDVKKPKHSIFTWLLPTGFAITALVLLTLNLQKNEIVDSIPMQVQVVQPQQQTAADSINLDLMAFALEAKLTTNIQKEQQAIVNDINYLKSLIVL